MESLDLLIECLRFSHTTLEIRMAQVEPAQAFVKQPGSGLVNPAAIYVHCVLDEDLGISRAAGAAPLSDKTGFGLRFGFEPRGDIDEAWAARLDFDLARFREWAAEVYARSETLLRSLSRDDVSRLVSNYEVIHKAGTVSYRERRMPLVFNAMDNVVLHTFEHAGEIAVLANLGKNP